MGATIAAVQGFSDYKDIVLILGGVGKGADFRVLRDVVSRNVGSLVLFGEDAADIGRELDGTANIAYCEDLEEVVTQAQKQSIEQGVVLFSPACASFDMFQDFAARGNAFRELVEGTLS